SEMINKHLGKIGMPMEYLSGKLSRLAGTAEGKAYEDASLISKQTADVSAAIGHQIPSTIIGTKAASGAGALLGKPTTLAGRMVVGASEGAAFGGAAGATQPDGHPGKDAAWGAILGGAFPLLGATMGLGRRSGSKLATAATEGAEKA